MGNPDGGWYDDTPPRVVSSSPVQYGVNTRAQKIVINFNEYIKLEDPQNKVIISPPQIEQPEIKAAGKRIIVELSDSLKPATTYTIDFSDAISDNNEGNPMGQYTFTFSTGEQIDTLEVSGYVLNAQDLEPMKGVLVGLYDNFSDTIIRSQPMMRISRTNGSGHFTIKGVAPGSYRVFALQDADGDYLFNQKSEFVAFNHDSIVPSWKPDTRQDTIWRDSLHIDNIVRVPYTHFLPDDITLLCFQEPQTDRFLLKTERLMPEKLSFYFTYGSDSLPSIEGLTFNADSAFVIEASQHLDTLHYWLRDTTLVNQDTLTMAVTFLATDTLGQLVSQTDTINFLPKVAYEKRQKERQKEIERWQKEQDKKKRRGQPYDSIMPPVFLQPRVIISGNIAPDQSVGIEVPQPLVRCDTSAIHLYVKIDTLWYTAPYTISQPALRNYTIRADWQEGAEYSLELDSAAMENIYGLVNNTMKQGIKVSTSNEFSTLVVTVSGAPISSSDTAAVVVVQMLDGSGKLVREAKANARGEAEFLYVKPAKYYLAAYIDRNGNGQWDTGIYDEDLQPEPVFYFNEEVECKAQWDVTRQWNLTATPLFRQKPAAITKQKPDQAKQLRNRNVERARQKGIQYIQQNTGVRL
ncbi:MAG: Ig-like domain-containing protein [Prevotella sp.]|nr:Ig-like domain-containing protein [Prevotella sp.]